MAIGRTSIPASVSFAIALASFGPGLKSAGSAGPLSTAFAVFGAAMSGQTAPWLIHSRIASICALLSGSPSLGMKSSSPFGRVMRRTISLLSALPTTNVGPVLPPLIAESFMSRRSLPFCFSSPWHLMQFWSKMGLMSLTKSTLSAAMMRRENAAITMNDANFFMLHIELHLAPIVQPNARA